MPHVGDSSDDVLNVDRIRMYAKRRWMQKHFAGEPIPLGLSMTLHPDGWNADFHLRRISKPLQEMTANLRDFAYR